MDNFYEKLFFWFKANARDLPWRRERSAYSVWISEVMLQQTQVKTVIPYYQKWMREYPSIATLAKASEQKVLKSWQGLGYYRRVLQIRKTALIVEKKFNGKFPNNYEEIITLPGIGDYTAKAILHFAFKKKVMAIDTNVFRIFSRLLLLKGTINSSKVKQVINEYSEKNFYPKKNYFFNEALFELGALICFKKNPLCTSCPVASGCLAYQKKIISEYPLSVKKKIIQVHSTSFIFKEKNKFLLELRKQENRLNKMWQFPTLEHHPLLEHLALERAFSKKYQMRISFREKITHFTHFYTKYKILYEVYQAEFLENFFKQENFTMDFFTAEEIEHLPLSRANQKIFSAIS